MLQLTLRIDADFDIFHPSSNKLRYVSQKTTLRRPNSLTKAMDGFFKYIGNRAWFARALSYWSHLETVRFGARA